MTTMTFAPAATGDDEQPENSYNAGYTDGELAAATGLSSRRAHARASMAHPHDPLYAGGYIDGYLDQVQRNAALRLRALLTPSQEGTTP